MLKSTIAKVEKYDKKLAIQLVCAMIDYELAWRGYYGKEEE